MCFLPFGKLCHFFLWQTGKNCEFFSTTDRQILFYFHFVFLHSTGFFFLTIIGKFSKIFFMLIQFFLQQFLVNNRRKLWIFYNTAQQISHIFTSKLLANSTIFSFYWLSFFFFFQILVKITLFLSLYPNWLILCFICDRRTLMISDILSIF